MGSYDYLLELTRKEAKSRGIKFVKLPPLPGQPIKIYMLPTNKENVWCYVIFRRNYAEADFDDVYDVETRIVEKTYSKFSELVANCPLHSFNGNFCKEKFIDSDPCYEWRDHGKLHRLDGPAVVDPHSFTRKWFLQDEETDEETVNNARDEAADEVISLI